MSRIGADAVCEDQTSHLPCFSVASGAEIHCNTLSLNRDNIFLTIPLKHCLLPSGAPSGSPLVSTCGADLLGCLLPCLPGSACCLLARLCLPLSCSCSPGFWPRLAEGVRNLISLRTLPSPPMTVLVMWTVPPSPVLKEVEQVVVPAGRSSNMLT